MKLLLATILLLPASAAFADPPPFDCGYNGAKFLPLFTKSVNQFLASEVKFAWNKKSLKINCGSGVSDDVSATYGCTVTFTANDGTPFALVDDITNGVDDNGCDNGLGSATNAVSVYSIMRSQATNSEGNYVGPITCTPNIAGTVDIVNQKTSVTVNGDGLGGEFPAEFKYTM